MRFYTQQRRFYCGIDLHARQMYVCILSADGEILFHKNMPARPEPFLKAIAPFRQDLVVGVECTFTWYWLADLCAREGIEFVLGHALYMRAIHGAKVKNDRVDSRKIAVLLRGGSFPLSYVYPQKMRGTRDLLRRRTRLVRQRAELLTHIQNTAAQYNLPPLHEHPARASDRVELIAHFPDPAVQRSIQVDLELIDYLDGVITDLHARIERSARGHHPQALMLLRTVHGIGKVLGLVILSHRLGRAVYFMLKRGKAFEMNTFLAN